MKRLIWALSLAAMAVAFTIACGNDRRAPTAPSGIAPPAASPSSLVCPADVEPTSPDGQPVAVTCAPPTLDTAGGSITAVCSPPSGSIFEVGTHTVTCVRSDGADAQCSFSIAVVVPELPQTILSVSTVLAFGDSLTEGEVSPAPSMLMAVQPGNDYPARLEALLRGRFPNQMMSVANRGLGGETASDGEDRFLGTFLDTEPDLVILLEGVNDLARGLLPPAARRTTPVRVARIRRCSGRHCEPVGSSAPSPSSHVRYDSADTPSRAANAACDFPNAIRTVTLCQCCPKTSDGHALRKRRRASTVCSIKGSEPSERARDAGIESMFFSRMDRAWA